MKAPIFTVPKQLSPFIDAVQKRWRWILFAIFLVEISLLLTVGIYHLAVDGSILYAALIIFSCAYIIGAARTVLSKKGIAAGGKTLKSTVIAAVATLLFGLALSAIRNRILATYFYDIQITALTLWFVTGIILSSLVTLIISLKQRRKY